MKKCNKCGSTENGFYRTKSHPDGLSYSCKICDDKKNKAYNLAHPDCNTKSVRNYRIKHRDRVLAYAKARNDQLRKTAKGKLSDNFRRRINKSLRKTKNGRSWELLVGYTAQKLKKHLEKHFLPGMTWDNYGEWHIDHRIPITAFNYEKPEDIDFKRCWALENLRPLWAPDNRRKLNKINKPFQPSLLLAEGKAAA